MSPFPWIQTASGRPFYPLHPRGIDLDIGDIAHALSNVCRFSGHTREFYSVAQHSVLVSHIAAHTSPGLEAAKAGLLHDAAEAYLGDLAGPTKHHEWLEHYREVEHRLQRLIFARWGLFPTISAAVRDIDGRMLATERQQLLTAPALPLPGDWFQYSNAYAPYGHLHLVPWTPPEARTRFMAAFRYLFGEERTP